MRGVVVCAAAVGAMAAAGVRAQDGEAVFRAYQAQMAAAEKSLRLGETRELRRWLEACEPEMRGWEWEHLSAIADTSVRRVKMAETPIRISLSPAGDRVATVEGSRVRVLSWPGLEEVLVIDGHTDAVYRAEFSADGARLVTVSRDVTSRTWDAATGSEIARIELANPAFAACAFSPSGEAAATCAWERDESGAVHGVVWVWDPATGEVRHRRRVGIKPLSAISFTPGGGADGAWMVVGSWDGLVHVLDARAEEVKRLALPAEGIYNAVDDVAVSPDGKWVAAASKDRTVRVFSLTDGELAASLRGHGGYVEGVSFSPDGSLLATSSADATVALWGADDWARRRVLRGAQDTVRGSAWSRDGAMVAACALDGHVWVWEAGVSDDGAVEIRTGTEGTYSCALSPDGQVVAVACHDGWMRLYDSRSGELRVEWEAHPGSTCHGAAFSTGGLRLITCSWDRTARVWDARDGREVARLEADEGVYACAISPDGLRAATAGATLQIWDVERGERMHRIAIEGAQARRVAFSGDGHMVASGWSDGRARVHDASDGPLMATHGGGGALVETVAFLPGNARLATGDAAGVVRVFPVRGGEAVFEVDTGGRGVNHLACSGARIAAATDQVWLIDAERRGIVLGLTPYADTIWHLCWSADEQRLATCAIGGVVKILGR